MPITGCKTRPASTCATCVELNFTLPKENDTYVPPKGQTLRQHIDGLWPVLTRSTVEVEKWDSLAAAA
ncbi:hypothetical protein LNP24_08085 [Klebsiella pneumoniae subsp. pneumoniae]|nr:hypothetical protein [Klebsiella pneumoniae subsp. pneumoniae]